jgi:hypothetical protein
MNDTSGKKSLLTPKYMRFDYHNCFNGGGNPNQIFASILSPNRRGRNPTSTRDGWQVSPSGSPNLSSGQMTY